MIILIILLLVLFMIVRGRSTHVRHCFVGLAGSIFVTHRSGSQVFLVPGVWNHSGCSLASGRSRCSGFLVFGVAMKEK